MTYRCTEKHPDCLYARIQPDGIVWCKLGSPQECIACEEVSEVEDICAQLAAAQDDNRRLREALEGLVDAAEPFCALGMTVNRPRGIRVYEAVTAARAALQPAGGEGGE